MNKLIYGVGVYRKGKYESRKNGKVTRWYSTWYNMIRRCYCPKQQVRQPTYRGCYVDVRFHHFQDFMLWAEQQIGFNDSSRLDKDILIKGNKIYSPETCVFVPEDINLLFCKSDASRGHCPIGVSYFKRDGNYSSQVTIKGKITRIGFYSTKEEAFSAYKIRKERNIKETAEQYKNVIDQRVYTALMGYEVLITD